MFYFFDYLFYRVSDFYITKCKDSQGMIYGVGVVSIIQMAHILLIIIVLSFASNHVNEFIFKQGEGKNFMHSGIIYPCLMLLGYNFYRYFRKISFEKAKLIWGEEKDETKKIRGRLLILYLTSSLIITISLSICRKYLL